MKTKIDDYIKWADDNNEVVENLEDSSFKNDMIQRNFNDWDKFWNNIDASATNLATQSVYMLTKTGAQLTGQGDSDFIKQYDQNMIDAKQMQAKRKERYQPDIEFTMDVSDEGGAFHSLSNFGKYS